MMGFLVLAWVGTGCLSLVYLIYGNGDDKYTPLWLTLLVLIYMGVPIALAFG